VEAPVSGRLAEILVPVGKVVQMTEQLGTIQPQ